MFDTSKQTFRWNVVLFAPTVLALLVVTLNPPAFRSQMAVIVWGIFNTLCCFWCAHDYSRPTTNLALRVSKTFGFTLIFWVLNFGTSFFGGCVCASAGGRS
ncbi:MAG: hypothetical protein H7X97_01435 [Opitutaceae bacterium]|nr:hypothetical protein [Verrucomicrobiales bacterium]